MHADMLGGITDQVMKALIQIWVLGELLAKFKVRCLARFALQAGGAVLAGDASSERRVVRRLPSPRHVRMGFSNS